MLADLVDHVIGIDPDRDRVTAVIVDTATRAETAPAVFSTTPTGYAALIEWADERSEPDGRAWSIEGAGSYGSGLCSTLQARGEWVIEFDHPQSRPAKDGAKTDGLDAARAAREVLGRRTFTQPRAGGTRDAIRALTITRRGAVDARVAAINELKSLIVTAPVELREQLRHHPNTTLVQSCRRLRITSGADPATAGTKTALRHLARRVEHLDDEITDIDRDLKTLVTQTAPQLLEEYGVGVVTAAQVIVSWSHPGRCRNEDAFARLAGVVPIPASSGQTLRYRLSRGGDRRLNHAIHMIAVTRARGHQETRDYIARRVAENKTPREAQRCIKHYIARRLYRLLEHPHTPPLTT